MIELPVPLGKAAESRAQRGGRPEAEVPLQRGGVGVCHRYVARLHGYQLFVGFKVVVRWQNVTALENCNLSRLPHVCVIASCIKLVFDISFL